MSDDSVTKLLIVDDLPENLMALEALIRDDGNYAIYRASSGEEALELLLQHEFALAILDVQMPGMTGFELAELMRGTEKTCHVPIVFVTAAGKDLDYSFKGYENGAVDFLHKPLDGYAVKSKVGVFADLNRQRKEAQQQLKILEETRAQLQQALNMRDEFMSMVAHELRTPLSVLSLAVQVRQKQLESGNKHFFGPAQLASMIEKDRRQVVSMTRLIEDMLDVSRIQNGKLSIRCVTTDLTELVRQAVENFTHYGSGNVITAEIEPGVTGHWDEFRLEQVIVNLLTNAMRYGGGKPIAVSLRTEGGKALIAVRDQGIGIAPEEQERIFERFVRVATPTANAGLGLGLYITKQLVDAHGAIIKVESRLGEGSTFIVALPL